MRAAVCGVVESFMSDLETHDKATLAELDPSTPFIWMAHDTGTHIVRSDADDDTIAAYRDAFDPRTGSCRSDGQRWHVWDGRTFQSETHERAFRTILPIAV